MIDAFTVYAIGCISVPWLICRSLQRPENSSRAILRYRYERSSDQFSNGDKGLGASASRPGSISLRSTEPLRVSSAFGGNDPIARGSVRAINGD